MLHYNLGVGTYFKALNRIIIKTSLLLNIAPNLKEDGIYVPYWFYGIIPESRGAYAIRQSSLGFKLDKQYGGKLSEKKKKITQKKRWYLTKALKNLKN